MTSEKEYLTIQEASKWASVHLGKEVSTANISYLIQYGLIEKFGGNGTTQVLKQDLIAYYESNSGQREQRWKKELGGDLNWALSFDQLTEKERTKHVHRLHPYKGKFIPQLVEYFLDDHVDDFKEDVYFKPGDIVLDPFCGSGTTLIQANELGIHAIGVDVSAFNAMISNVKIRRHDLFNLHEEARKITVALKEFIFEKQHVAFETELSSALVKFNNEFFPSPQFRYDVRQGKINELKYGAEKEKEFRIAFEAQVSKHGISIRQGKEEFFIDKWYVQAVREEIDYVFGLIQKVEDPAIRMVLAVILSRTMRSCRATTHADLATLLAPVFEPYYCRKHGKVCKPLFSILSWWERYSQDTQKRLAEFNKLRTNTFQYCISGDSRNVNVLSELSSKLPKFSDLVTKQKIKGIFSSPPYVGLIDYHEQHAYAYDLLGFEKNSDLEIGPLYKGQGKEARDSYVTGISEVLLNSKKFLADDYDIFLVANDKFGLYPAIAERSGMRIVNEFRRPVLHRTEKNKTPYSETIFHLKDDDAN